MRQLTRVPGTQRARFPLADPSIKEITGFKISHIFVYMPYTETGYQLGLNTIREALEQLCEGETRDIHYWKDSIRWLGRTCNLVRDRVFILSALSIMQQVSDILRDTVRVEILRASCGLQLESTDVDILERILRLASSAICAADVKEGQVMRFVSALVDTVISAGDPGSMRVEIISHLLRVCCTLSANEHLLALAEMILKQSDSVNGKVLWTLADAILSTNICFADAFEGGDQRWVGVARLLAQSLIANPSMKAKWHVARALNHIRLLPDCPAGILRVIQTQMSLCRQWLEHTDAPSSLEPDLYEKYRQGLLSELA